MWHKLKRFQVLILLCGIGFSTGCGERNAAPVPMPREQVRGALEKTFKDAAPPIKAKADEAVAALNGTNETQALFILQTLSNRSDLTTPQREVTVRCLLTVVARVQSAATNGNSEAAEAIQYRRDSK